MNSLVMEFWILDFDVSAQSNDFGFWSGRVLSYELDFLPSAFCLLPLSLLSLDHLLSSTGIVENINAQFLSISHGRSR